MRKTQSALDSKTYSIVKDRREPRHRPVLGRSPSRGAQKTLAAARCRWKPLPRLPSTASSLDRARAGGADRDRTDDLRLAKPALSQLSYSPNKAPDHLVRLRSVVGLGRFELPTSRLSGGRSNQLSYRPAGRGPYAQHRSGLQKLNSARRRPGQTVRVAPRLNELPGKPGIQAIVSSRPAHEARGVRDADRLRPGYAGRLGESTDAP